MSELLMHSADRAHVATGPRVIVLGRQGAGKGTQCARLASHLGVRHLSTGDLFRAAIAADTPIGRQAKAYVEQGALVPDEFVLDLVAAQVGDAATRQAGYLLDGFPRTLAQGQALFEVIGAKAADLAVEIHVTAAAVLPRLAARRVCTDCGRPTTAPNGDVEVACPGCSGPARRRGDDADDDAIARRLALYDVETGPLLVWLADRSLLVSIDGIGSPDDVFARITAAVDARLPQRQRRTTAGS